MFAAELRAKCIRQFEKRISLPQIGFFVLTAIGARICYKLDGELLYINITSRIELAKLLYKHGLIKNYYIENGHVIMTKLALSIKKIGNSKAFHQTASEVFLSIGQVKLTPSEVIHIAAVKEYEATGAVMGIVSAKIIPLYNSLMLA